MTNLNQYQALINKYAWRFASPLYDINDLKQEAAIAIWKAYNHYDTSKGSFIGYAALCVKRALINYTRKSPPLFLSLTNYSYEPLYLVDYLPALSNIESLLLELKLANYSNREIATICNKSRTWVRSTIKKLFIKIRKANEL